MIDDATNCLKVKRGSELPQSILTEEDVRLARQLHQYKKQKIAELNQTLSAEALAEKFGVSLRAMEHVLSYRTWRHV